MKLIFLAGPIVGSRYEVEGSINIGRDPSNDIVIPDVSVSLVHCQISYDDGRATIKDLGSTNGTFVNKDRTIVSDVLDGDQLVIGTNVIRIELPEQPSAAETHTIHMSGADQSVGRMPDTIKLTGDAQPQDELAGNIFGNVTYFLKRRIADGGMGSIYEAEQIGAEGFIKKVAIKTILPKFAHKQSFVSSFVGEAKLVANLVHQNIVQIHHLGRKGEGYYIAMEYIDGITLTEFLMEHARLNRRPPVDICTFIISRICRGLEYAHTKKGEGGRALGLVHRDVSPNNIMISREGEVKLTDFGVAKAGQFMEADEDSLVGSVEYMSPEQAACAAVDARSDVFSLGLVYYELLTGVRVFQYKGEEIEQALEKVKTSEIPEIANYRRELPLDVAEMVMKCVQKRPSKRFQAAGDLSAELEHSMYSKGLGPTIVSLSKYVAEMKAEIAQRRMD